MTIAQPASAFDADDTAPLLRATDVSRFYGDRVGCAGVTFDLWPGEVLGVVGESGSGKRRCCVASPDSILRPVVESCSKVQPARSTSTV